MIMPSELQIILAALEEAIDRAPTALHFGSPEPFPLEPIYIHPVERVFLVFEGKKPISYADGQKRIDRELLPGEFLILPRGGWSVEHWTQPHRMLAIAFWDKFTRVITIEHDGHAPPTEKPDAVHHTRNSLTPAGQHTLQALLATNADLPEARANLAALLHIVRRMVGEEEGGNSVREEEWKRVHEALQLNFHNGMTREEVALLAGVHPARLSRLLKEFRGQTFAGYMNELRLAYARVLLQQPTLPVEEIAERCGYRYANYFIKVFRKEHGLTPGDYRRALP